MPDPDQARLKRPTISTWRDFQLEIDGLLDGNWLFRGVSSARHLLQPSIGRWRVPRAELPAVERRFFERFQREAIPFIATRPANPWQWLALAQHHGTPTRLLDWSESPYVSLYFAVWGNDHLDAALYAVPRPDQDAGIGDASTPFDLKDVAFFYPEHAIARISAQRGLFTVHPDPTAIYAPAGAQQFIIKAEAKREMRRKLDAIGVHHSQIFADLDGLSRRLVAIEGFRLPPEPADPRSPAPPKRAPVKFNPDDPQKGQWGGRSKTDRWVLSAKVTAAGDNWFDIELKVKGCVSTAKLTKKVTFHLHDTFREPVQSVTPGKDGVARLELSAYGAFTVGVLVEQDGTQLELDLAKTPGAPRAFKTQ